LTAAPDLAPAQARAGRAAFALLLALGGLALLWETLLAPARPGGSWLALKALPLLALAPGVARGSRRAGQIASLLVPWYAAEGIARAASETGRHALVAATSAALAIAAFAALLLWLRRPRAP
jgi:uncharacterized membrane protein